MHDHQEAGPAHGDHVRASESPERAEHAAAPMTGAGLIQLQRKAGNQAVVSALSGTVQRTSMVLQRDPSEADLTRAKALEARMDVVSKAAAKRGEGISAKSDAALKDLQATVDKLNTIGTNYRAGWDKFNSILVKGDKHQETRDKVADLVQGMVIGVIAAFVLPEALVGAAALKAAEAANAAMKARLIAAGVKALNEAAKDGIENAVDAGASAAKGETPKAAETAGGAGKDPAEKLTEILASIGTMVKAMPALGSVSSTQWGMSRGADQAIKDSKDVRLGDVDVAKLADIEKQAAALEAENGSSPAIEAKVADQVLRVANLKAQLAGSGPPKTPDEYEMDFWNAWMPSLIGDKNELLDNDEIQQYLVGKGLLSDEYMSDSDQGNYVKKAQRKWLEERGIAIPSDDVVGNLYLSNSTREQLNSKYRGTTGKIVFCNSGGRGTIDLGGKTFTYSGNAGAHPAGTELPLSVLVLPTHYTGTENIADWEGQFEVLTLPPVAREAAPEEAPNSTPASAESDAVAEPNQSAAPTEASQWVP